MVDNNLIICKCQKCKDSFFGKRGKELCYWCNSSYEASIRMEKFYGKERGRKQTQRPKRRRYVAPPTDNQMTQLIKEVVACPS